MNTIRLAEELSLTNRICALIDERNYGDPVDHVLAYYDRMDTSSSLDDLSALAMTFADFHNFSK